MSMVTMYRCGVGVVVKRYIDILTVIINFPLDLYSTCISSFLAAAASLLLCTFLKCFFVLYNYNSCI